VDWKIRKIRVVGNICTDFNVNKLRYSPWIGFVFMGEEGMKKGVIC